MSTTTSPSNPGSQEPGSIYILIEAYSPGIVSDPFIAFEGILDVKGAIILIEKDLASAQHRWRAALAGGQVRIRNREHSFTPIDSKNTEHSYVVLEGFSPGRIESVPAFLTPLNVSGPVYVRSFPNEASAAKMWREALANDMVNTTDSIREGYYLDGKPKWVVQVGRSPGMFDNWDDTHRAIHDISSRSFQWFARSEEAAAMWALMQSRSCIYPEGYNDIPTAGELLDCTTCYNTRKDICFALRLASQDDEYAHHMTRD